MTPVFLLSSCQGAYSSGGNQNCTISAPVPGGDSGSVRFPFRVVRGFQGRIRRVSLRLCASAANQTVPCGNQNWSVSGPVQGGGTRALKCRKRQSGRACTAVPGRGIRFGCFGASSHPFCTRRKMKIGTEMVRKRCSFSGLSTPNLQPSTYSR